MKRALVLAILVGILLTFYALFPQMQLREKRGDDFQGAFASCDLDEMAYASYLQALIDGRPRRNDPYTGRDHRAENPQPESLFSIQFFPSYLAAVPARIFDLSASQMMPVISAASAFLTALALFWLVMMLTDDPFLSFAGTLVVMTGAALVSGIGAINGYFEGGVAYPFFPYLRRPVPSLAFPFLFAFFGCIWKGLTSDNKRLLFSILAALSFSVLVFSYFYLWTSAAAVLLGWFIFTLIIPSENRRRDLIFLLQTGAFYSPALVLYAWLLSNRNPMTDKAQLLVFTRELDLWRTVEVIGYIVLIATILGLWRRIFDEKRKAYFIAACALAPFIVFNQQLLTGRSLQPFHYEFYSVNYILLLSLCLIVASIWQKFFSKFRLPHLTLVGLAAAGAGVWGYIEASETTKIWDDINARRDEAMPVNMRLRGLATADFEKAKRETTLNLEALQADSQPTVAPQPVLWARHQNTFAGVESWEENKLRYYHLLYYSDLDAAVLRNSLTECRDIEACMALFGWDRFNARLSANARPLTQPEIDEEVKQYDQFYKNFDADDAAQFELSRLIIYQPAGNKLINVNKWFELDGGEQAGTYTLHRLKLR